MLDRSIQYFAILLCLATITGCSSSSGGQASSGSCTDHLPSNIDATLCANITGGSDSTKRDQCLNCCEAGGYGSSAFTNADQCACAKSQDDAGTTVCADQLATAAACTSCCTTAGYQVESWLSDTSCQCFTKHDATICGGTLGESEPDKACSCCCLSNGYISYFYVGIGQPECNCIDG